MSSPQKRRFAPTVELLEQRELLSASGMGILVPAYQYPTNSAAMWSQLDSAALTSKVPIMAILNPGSGPGAAYDSTYGAAVDALRTDGGKVIGYVPTWWGNPSQGFSLATAETEISDYKSWYHLDGIFLDQMGTNDSVVSAYQSLYSYIKALQPSWTVVANPGTAVDSVYGNGHTADTFVDFEHGVNADSNGPAYANYTPPTWAASTPNRLANIVNDVTTVAQMQAVVQQAVNQHAGWIYVNSDTAQDPSYGLLPTASIWSAELTAVASDVAPVTQTLAPAAPTLTATIVSGTQVSLSWNSVANATGYAVEKWTGSGWATITTLPGGSTSYLVSGLTPGTTYFFTVGAVNAAGTTLANWQDVVMPSTLPAAPTLTAKTVSGTQVSLSWNTVANATSYAVEKWTGSGWATIATLGVGSTSYLVSGLTPGTTYFFTVGAVNASGTTLANWQSALA
jgi:multidrug transporter EmrE-like cation transporter